MVAPRLGFEIDTSELARARGEAAQTAQALGGLGAAADGASERTSRGLRQIVDSMARMERQVAGGASATAAAMGRLESAVAGAAAEQRTAAEAARRLAEEQLQQEAAARKAAEERQRNTAARRQAAEFERLSSALDANARAQNAAAKAAAKHARQQKVLDAALQSGKASPEQHRALSQKLAEQYSRAGGAAEGLANSMGQLGSAGQSAAERMANFAQAIGAGGASAGGRALAGAFDAASGAAQGFFRLIGAPGPMAIGAASAVTLAGSYIGLNAVLAEAHDRWARYTSQIKIATGGTNDSAIATLEKLKTSANTAGVSLDATVQVFSRMARSAKDFGATDAEAMKLAETIQKIGIVGNVTTQEMSSGMLQLSQALGSGRLNGDELRSIMENMPTLAQAIADGMGIPYAMLRQMGERGELDAERVFRAILSQREKFEAQFKDMPETTERAFARMSNQASEFGANLAKAINAPGLIQGLMNGLGGAMAWANDKMSGKMSRFEEDETVFSNQKRIAAFERAGVQNLTYEENQTLSELRGQNESIIAAQRARVKAALDEQKKEGEQKIRKPTAAMQRGLTLASEIDTETTKREKSKNQADQLRAALSALDEVKKAGGVSDAEYVERQGRIRRALAINSKEAAGLGKATETLSSKLADQKLARQLGGGGGGTAIAQKAIESARGKSGSGSVESNIAALVAERGAETEDEVEKLTRQAEAQRKLAESVGLGRDAAREQELAAAAAEFQFSKFGTLSAEKFPVIKTAVDAYTKALRDNKAAADALADSKAEQALKDQLSVLEAGAKAAAGGAYAMERAEAEAQAAVADRQAPGEGGRQLRLFDANEARQYAQTLAEINRQTDEARRMAGAVTMSDAQRIQRDLGIEQAQRGVAPERRDEFGAAMRAKAEADIAAQVAQQNAQMREQIDNSNAQLSTLYLYGEELAAQTAVLAKKSELQRIGAQADTAEYDAALALADQMGRTSYRNDQLQESADDWRKSWDEAASGVSGSISSAILQVGNGSKSMLDTFKSSLSNVVKSFADGVLKQLLMPMQQQIAASLSGLTGGGGGVPKVGGGGAGWFESLIGATSSGGGDGGAASFAMEWMSYMATGGAFDTGGARRFATGGAFTNQIVTAPTPFRFSRGGRMAPGLMGEAGPEAIMPLKQASGGGLGVMATIGGKSTVLPIGRDGSGRLSVKMDGGPSRFASGGTFGGGAEAPRRFASGGVFDSTGAGSAASSSQNGAGSVAVVVNNFGAERVRQKEVSDGRGGRRIELTIGDMVAGEMARPGSAAQRGARQAAVMPLVRR